MGDPKRLRRKYESPRHPWEKIRIDEEKTLREEYGLKNKKEVWRAKSVIRRYRGIARKLIGLSASERQQNEKELLEKLCSVGLVPEKGTLDDVLLLDVKHLLERRLQTIVWKKGLAKTVKEARQSIVHGHVTVNGRKASSPSRIIDLETEKKVELTKKYLTRKPKPKKPKEKKTVEKVEEKVEKTEGKPVEESKKPEEKVEE